MDDFLNDNENTVEVSDAEVQVAMQKIARIKEALDDRLKASSENSYEMTRKALDIINKEAVVRSYLNLRKNPGFMEKIQDNPVMIGYFKVLEELGI